MPLVVAKIMGGLGNQMFQYATGLAFAKSIHADYRLDLGYYMLDKKLNNTPRKFELGVFDFSFKSFQSILSNYFVQAVVSKFSFIRRSVLPVVWIKYYTDIDKPDKTSNIMTRGLYYLDGYWPSYLYFDDYRNEVLKHFSFGKTVDEINARLSEVLQTQNSIAVHIRRTDYLQSNSIHKVLPFSYFGKAIDHIQSKITNPVFYFFGDDHQWIKSNFPIDDRSHILVTHNTGDNSHLDMFLMSKCRHNIISNSTFSWWAAYLNTFNENITIAPTDWLKDGASGYFIYDQLIPDKWIKI